VILRFMARLRLTLDEDTYRALSTHAKKAHVQLATYACTLLKEALARRKPRERTRKLVADYSAGRADARTLLEDLEGPQVKLPDEDR
jgi:hypothetical protein